MEKPEANPMDRITREPPSLRTAPRCGATTRNGTRCQRPASTGKARCRLHGGAPGSGAPSGIRNGSYKHGRYTREALEEARILRAFARECQRGLLDIG